jgi:hypothetical protein
MTIGRSCKGELAMRKNPSEKYLEKAKLMTKAEIERLMARPRAKSIKMSGEKLSELECVAIELEIEDEHLNEWRAKAAEIRAMEKEKTEQNTVH